MPEIHDNRKDTIDGLPSSFNHLFVIRSKKKCELCNKYIKKDEIEKRLILYTDEFELVHKPCLSNDGIYYKHLREDDLNSPVKLIIPTRKSKKAKSHKGEQ